MLRLKPVGQAVGLVAVMVILLAVPGVTQQNPLTRQDVVSAVSDFLGVTFTASAADILDPELVTFISNTDTTLTFIPVARESSSAQRFFEEVFSGDFDPLFLGILLVDVDPILPQGTYQLYLTSSSMQVLDQDGRVIEEFPVEITDPGVDLSTVPWEPKLHVAGPFIIDETQAVQSEKAATQCNLTGAQCSYTKRVECDDWQICIWRWCPIKIKRCKEVEELICE